MLARLVLLAACAAGLHLPTRRRPVTTKRMATTAPLAQERRAWRREKRKEVLVFAAPALSTVLADPLMSMFDALVCGRCCSTLEFASLGPALAVFNFVNYGFFFLNAATTVNVANALARDNRKAATETLSCSVSVAALCGLAVAALMIGAGPNVVQLTGCVPELVPVSTAYLRVRAFGSPVVLASMVAQAGLLAQRDSATPLQAVSLAVVLNIVGDLLLVPRMGAVGAAWATLFSQAAMLPYLLWLARKRDRLPVKLRMPSREQVGPLFAAAKPLFVFEMGLSVCYGVIQSMGTQFSVAATAAFQALWNPTAFLAFMTYPLKQASAVFLPALGAERPENVGGRPKTQQFLLALLTIAWPLGLLVGGASYLCAMSPQVFAADRSLDATIKSFGPLVAGAAMMLPFVQISEGTLLGTGDLGYLSRTQFLNVAVACAAYELTKRAGMGVRGTFVVLAAFYVSRLAQGLLRVFVFRPPWCRPGGGEDADGRGCVV